MTKPRKPLQRRAPLVAKKPLQQKTELKRGGPIKRRRSNAEPGSVGSSRPRSNANGPVKARSESTHIPEPIRLAAYARDEWRCMCCGVYIPTSGRRWCLQHRDARGMGGSKLRHTLPNLVLVCGWTVDPGTCTRWMEVEDRLAATALGWLVPNGVTPEEWPVYRWTPAGPVWMQPGVTWELASPHERQREMGAAA